MSRINALLVAAGMAVAATGCSQCDTCDDFPTPCIGPNCGGYTAPAHTSGVMMTNGSGEPPSSIAPVDSAPTIPTTGAAPAGTGAVPAPPTVNPEPITPPPAAAPRSGL